MIHIDNPRGGEITVTYDSTTYLYENLPTEAQFALVKELRKYYPGYLTEYRKLKFRFCERVATRKLIEKLIKLRNDGVKSNEIKITA